MKTWLAAEFFALWGVAGAGSIMAHDGSASRPDPASTVFLDNAPGVENGSVTCSPDTRTCHVLLRHRPLRLRTPY